MARGRADREERDVVPAPHSGHPMRPAPRMPRFSGRTVGPLHSRTPSPNPLLERTLNHFIRLGCGPDGPKRLVQSADAVLTILRKAAEAECWPGVLELARTAEPALALSGRWGAWGAVLEFALSASRALGDRQAEGWALHQLGVRALALGDEVTARSLLSQALVIRSEEGPAEAADVTASQLRQLIH
jgi:hypothetical protein